MKKGNANAYYALGSWYDDGSMGLRQNRAKANELYLKAGELGCAEAYFNLGTFLLSHGRGVEIDEKKAKHYYELAAMKGNVKQGIILGCNRRYKARQSSSSIQTLY